MSDDRLNLVKNMFAAMDTARLQAAKSPSRYVGDINLTTYQPKFGVSDQDVADYCATLPPLIPQYPTCILCGREWSSLEKTVKPICGGTCIDWYDSFDMWCCGSESDSSTQHDTVWYRQYRDGHTTFTMEVEELNGRYYDIRWSCDCMVPECAGRNVVYDTTDQYHSLLYGPFTLEELPYNITHQQLAELLSTRTPTEM